MIGDSFLDRIAGRVRLTQTLKILEDLKAVVRALTFVLWGGIVQVLISAIILAAYGELCVTWALVGAAVMFAVSWDGLP